MIVDEYGDLMLSGQIVWSPKRFILKRCEKLWKDYEYNILCHVAKFETEDEMKANMPRGLNETQQAGLNGYGESKDEKVL